MKLLLLSIAAIVAMVFGLILFFAVALMSEEATVRVTGAAAAEARRQASLVASDTSIVARCLNSETAPTGAADILDAEQVGYARVIITTTLGEALPQRAAVIAVATAMQESSLKNVNYGDEAGPDSRGLFQQRLQFYAAEGDPMDPVVATQMFLRRLINVANWETRPLTEAAQAVQISALPNAYAKWETLASDLVVTYWTEPCDPIGALSAIDGYAPPIDPEWWADRPHRFVGTHHDYPSVDVGLPTGTPSYAVTAGRAQHVGGACGNGVAIDSDDGFRFIYCHFDSYAIRDGVRVQPGQLIGYVGNTGNSFGPHLHFDIRVNGQHVCPQNFMRAIYTGQPISIASLPRSGCTH